jgi:hypothetical protein
MNGFLSNSDVFEDALTQLKKDKLENPFFIQPIGEVEEIEEYIPERNEMPGVFFLEGDLILDHSRNGVHFFHTSNEKLVGRLGTMGEPIVKDRKDFPLYVFYFLFMCLKSQDLKSEDLGYQPLRKPFERNKGRFADKLFYYLEIPVDPITLKEWGIEPDMRAVNYEAVIDL